MEKYNKMKALNYLIDTGPAYINEWTEAGMYNILSDVIRSKKRYFDKEYLDELLKKASNF